MLRFYWLVWDMAPVTGISRLSVVIEFNLAELTACDIGEPFRIENIESSASIPTAY